jgi:transcriptional regulator with XRE-family HTH domain
MFSKDIIAELSRRAKEYRLAYPLTQKELADKAGVSLRAVQKFESGQEVMLDIFVKILMALDLSENFDVLIPDMSDRPSAMLAQLKGKKRQRVRKKKNQKSNQTFKWGDEK